MVAVQQHFRIDHFQRQGERLRLLPGFIEDLLTEPTCPKGRPLVFRRRKPQQGAGFCGQETGMLRRGQTEYLTHLDAARAAHHGEVAATAVQRPLRTEAAKVAKATVTDNVFPFHVGYRLSAVGYRPKDRSAEAMLWPKADRRSPIAGEINPDQETRACSDRTLPD